MRLGLRYEVTWFRLHGNAFEAHTRKFHINRILPLDGQIKIKLLKNLDFGQFNRGVASRKFPRRQSKRKVDSFNPNLFYLDAKP